MGCVARPSLEESNIALVVDYVENYPSAFLSSEESHQGNLVPYLPAIKVSLVKKDVNGFLKAFDSNGLEILGDGIGFFYIGTDGQLDP